MVQGIVCCAVTILAQSFPGASSVATSPRLARLGLVFSRPWRVAWRHCSTCCRDAAALDLGLLLPLASLPVVMPGRKRLHAAATWDVSDDETAASAVARRVAGKALLDKLLSLYASAKLSAEDFCVCCFHAARAGTPGGDFDLYAKASQQRRRQQQQQQRQQQQEQEQEQEHEQ